MVQNCSKALQLQQDQSRKAKTSKAQTTMETLPRCSPVATLQDGGSKEPQAALKPKRRTEKEIAIVQEWKHSSVINQAMVFLSPG